MKRLLITIFVCITMAGLSAQDVEIYPQLIPTGGTNNSSAFFSPDGKWLVSRDLYSSQILDTATGREFKTYNWYISSWSPDGKSCLSQIGNSIILWDPMSGHTIKRLPQGENFSCVAYSPDGRRIVLFSEDRSIIRILDIGTGTELKSISIPIDISPIYRLAFSPDGLRIIATYYRGAKIWDVETGREIMTLSSPAGSLIDIDHQFIFYSPDGKTIIYPIYRYSNGQTAYTATIIIASAETGREMRRFAIGSKGLASLTCSSDGKKIITVEWDERERGNSNNAKVWDINTGREVITLRERDAIWWTAYSPDGKRIAYKTAPENGNHSLIKILDAATYQELFIITSLPPVYTTVSPNNKWIAAVTQKTVKIWDKTTGNVIRISSRGSEGSNIEDACWSLDGKKIAFTYNNGDKDTKGIILDVESNKQTLIDRQDFIGLQAFSYSPDNRQVLLATLLSINVFDVSSGNRLFSINKAKRNQDGSMAGLPPRLMHFNGVSWHPAGRQIVISYEFDGDWVSQVMVYDTQTGREIRNLGTGMDGPVYSPDGRRIAARSSDMVKIWDSASGQEIRSSIKHEKLSAIAYTPDGRTLITGGENNFVAAWNAENGTKLWEKNLYADIDTLSVSLNSKTILAAIGETISVIDTATGNLLGELGGFRDPLTSASFSSDNKWIAAASKDGTVRVWSAETFVEKAMFISYDDGEWLAVTPDGYYAASARGDQYLNVRVGTTVTGIDRYRSTFNRPDIVAARLSNPERMTHQEQVHAVILSSDGKRAASGSTDKTIKLWDAESGRIIRTFSGHTGGIAGLAFSPDNRRMASCSADKAIKLWDVETGREIRTLTGHGEFVNSVKFSPDGRRIVSSADDKTIKIWEVETGKVIRTLSGHSDEVWDVLWSSDGKLIASGSKDKTIKLWNAESGQLLRTLTGHSGSVYDIVFSPDAKRLVSCSGEDKTIRIWETETGRPVKTIQAEVDEFFSLAYSPDGKRFASGALYAGEDDGGDHIKIWDAETGAESKTIWENGTITSLIWTPDGRRIFASCVFSDANFIRDIDTVTGNEL
jgi:WD40 repeat protein